VGVHHVDVVLPHERAQPQNPPQIARAAPCQAGAGHLRGFRFGDEVILVHSEVGDPHIEEGPVPEASLVDHQAFRTARPEPFD
jgi:hypothetical protein